MRSIRQITKKDALVHQVHPVKLGTDVAAAIASTALLWRRRPLAGLLIRYLPPMAASALVLAVADLDRLRDTPTGRYAIRHMPDGAVAARMAGDTLIAAAAWRHSVPGIAAGTALIAAGWSHGLLQDKPRLPATAHPPTARRTRHAIRFETPFRYKIAEQLVDNARRSSPGPIT